MNIFNILKFGILFILLSLLSVLFNIIMGFIGIQFFYGTVVALLITIISIYFKVILPLYIGSYLGMIQLQGFLNLMGLILQLQKVLGMVERTECLLSRLFLSMDFYHFQMVLVLYQLKKRHGQSVS